MDDVNILKRIKYNFQWYILGLTPFHYDARKDSNGKVITDENGIPLTEKLFIEPFEKTLLDIRFLGIPLLPVILVAIVVYLLVKLIKTLKL